MEGPLLELRRHRRALLGVLASRGGRDRRFSWRRLHLVLPGGRAGMIHADERLSRTGVRLSSFFEAFNEATADRIGVPLHVVLTIYPVSTYLPAVSSGPHTFDFDLEPVREAGSLSAAEARRIFEEEERALAESPWKEPTVRWYLDRLEPAAEPKLIAVRDSYDPAVVQPLWCVAELSDYVLLLDGNRRFGLALRYDDEPLPGRGIYADLADALQTAEWA